MSLRKDLEKEIALLEKEMQELEFKRTRSMASLIESLITYTAPNETEMQFFRQYTAEIEVKRERLMSFMEQLKGLKG